MKFRVLDRNDVGIWVCVYDSNGNYNINKIGML